jgi:hypothetical protein
MQKRIADLQICDQVLKEHTPHYFHEYRYNHKDQNKSCSYSFINNCLINKRIYSFLYGME